MPLDATIGTSFLNTYGRTTVDLQTFAGDSPLVGIYFSAHWCGPCRNFTPKLVTFLTMLEEEGVRLPVVFGSSDKDEASFQSYFASMTGDQWHAFPLGDARHPSGSSHPEASADAPLPRQPAPAPDRVPPRQPRPAWAEPMAGVLAPATPATFRAHRRASRRSRSSLG